MQPPDEFTVLSDYDKYEKRWAQLTGTIAELRDEVMALRRELREAKADLALLRADLQERQKMDARQRNMYIRRGIPFHFQPDSSVTDTGGAKSLMERLFGD